MLDALDKAFQYDDRALDKFFYGLYRRPDQTLFTYCGDHREALREVEKHGIRIPAEVEAWILLCRSGLTNEQRQLMQPQVAEKFTAAKVDESMFFCQHYETTSRQAGASSGGCRRTYGICGP